MKQQKFVFLESNTTGTGELLLKKARDKGFLVIFLTKNPKKYPFLSMEAIKTVVIDTDDEKVLLAYLRKEKNIVGLYSSSEYYIESVARLASFLCLIGTNIEAVHCCRDKYKLYESLLKTKISVPKTKSVNSIEQFLEQNYVFPLIVKPVNGSGSVGVKLCENQKIAMEHIAHLLKNHVETVIIQEYIEGKEFSVEVCSISSKHHIIGITKKYLGKKPYFVEVGHDFPAILKKEEEENISEVVQTLLTHLNFNFGFSHLEIRIKADKVFVIEVNPRLAGGMIPVLIEMATGVDVLDVLLGIYAQQITSYPNSKCKKFTAIRHLLPKSEGVIKKVAFNSDVDVDLIKWHKKKGELISIQGDFRDRIAYAIVSDVSQIACATKAEKILESFNIEVEKK